jgi:hypothetical protein
MLFLAFEKAAQGKSDMNHFGYKHAASPEDAFVLAASASRFEDMQTMLDARVNIDGIERWPLTWQPSRRAASAAHYVKALISWRRPSKVSCHLIESIPRRSPKSHRN